MFYLLSKTLDLLVAPLTWALLLVAAALTPAGRKTLLRTRALLGGAVAVLWVFSLEPVANGLFRALEGDAGPAPPETATWDAVVLLGGVVDPGAVAPAGEGPSYNDNVERLLRTYELLRADRAKVAVITGAMGDKDPDSEAHRLARQLVAWGIAPERLVLEPDAMNTRENAVNTARILRARGLARVVIVTSAFHMERARECFRAVDVAVDTFPVDRRTHPVAFGSLLPRASALDVSTGALREGFGRWVYRARGYGRR